jgi:hypothetical protein
LFFQQLSPLLQMSEHSLLLLFAFKMPLGPLGFCLPLSPNPLLLHNRTWALSHKGGGFLEEETKDQRQPMEWGERHGRSEEGRQRKREERRVRGLQEKRE